MICVSWFLKMILKCLASLIFQMVHFQRVFSFVFRFSLTGAFLWFSIKASFISFFYLCRKDFEMMPKLIKDTFFPKQDVLSYCQRPTDTKVKYFKLNKQKHCQRHNGPEGWVHITSSNTNLDHLSSSESRHGSTSKSQPNINLPIKLKLQNLDQT